MRGTELPRTESREGRKKALAEVCTMSRVAARSSTCDKNSDDDHDRDEESCFSIKWRKSG